MDPHNPDDPKGLIRESFRIDGISASECRSILVDWALSLPIGADQPAALSRLHGQYAATPDHPMSRLLTEARAAKPGEALRRGGRAGRFSRGDGVPRPAD